MVTSAKERLAQLLELERTDLWPNGYQRGLPPWLSDEASAIDDEACATGTCETCGDRGLEYWPYFNAAERSYRAVCRCPGCGRVDDF